MLRYGDHQLAGARADLDWLLEHKPLGINLDEVEQLVQVIDAAEK